ncbi:MmcQ/YjbR family DNA-binding protein [Arthrobacter castelli]|uniref:MmcQ/YjbR family DNA-binding protein n=1 Tax=Arthrobacter castelli TaxID=271431 RepID=UPI00041CAA58|nr:MmcQ/YjbR family DNA-binding protein [Arthrobacter castelli]
MTTMAQLRKAALGLPEVEEGTHFGKPAFTVRGKGFVSVTKDNHVQLPLPDDAVEKAMADHPTGERMERMGRPIGFRIPLADINGKELTQLVRASWSSRAPKRLAASLADVDGGGVPTVSDLPPGIGKPATRALLTVGITTLDEAAGWSKAELLSLHGVGPKAVRILGEALEGRGEPSAG